MSSSVQIRSCNHEPRLSRLKSGALAAISLGLAASTTLHTSHAASEVVNECSGSGGDDAATLDTSAKKVQLKDGGPSYSYTVVDEVRLKQLRGHCISGSQSFAFNQELFGVTVEFTADNKKQRKKFLCLNYKYDTPPGRSCDREVRQIDWTAPNSVSRPYR